MWRVGICLIIGALAALAANRWRLALPTHLDGDLLAAKLALLGIMLAAGTFQSQAFSEQMRLNEGYLLDEGDAELAASVQLEQETGEPARKQLEARIARARNHQDYLRKEMPGIIRANSGIMWSTFAIGLLLAIASVADVVALIAPRLNRWSRAVSLGFLGTVLMPFSEIGFWYAVSLLKTMARCSNAFQ